MVVINTQERFPDFGKCCAQLEPNLFVKIQNSFFEEFRVLVLLELTFLLVHFALLIRLGLLFDKVKLREKHLFEHIE